MRAGIKTITEVASPVFFRQAALALAVSVAFAVLPGAEKQVKRQLWQVNFSGAKELVKRWQGNLTLVVVYF
ncbi:hypothetical protein [Escherichia coli]|uniref:hypothetical protein n=1 Tax=Escherichia coli TaxID=562 RepID=UPI002559B25E|nr:hypothetical protein [Escherichia coli]